MQLQENLVVADRFRLVRVIGRGGMGSVWEAVNVSLDQPCALKFIEGANADMEEARARFEREAKAAAQLRSPHIVQIIDHGIWQNRPYIAMELLDGEDLGRTLTRAGGRLPPARVDFVVQQVCRALTKAHQAGIVHRDLKPDNIFLVNDDDRQFVKILDFGVAKHSSGLDGTSNTKTGAMIGTPYYMSPEQAQGVKTVDTRSDLWSLAVIVYRCLLGQLPFDSGALGDLLVKIIVNPVPVPSRIAPDVPPGFDAWWAKATQRTPDERFQTAKDFAASLTVALGLTARTTESTPNLRSTAMMHDTPGGPVSAQSVPSFVQGIPGSTPSPSVPVGSVPTPAFGGAPMPQAAHPPAAMGQTPHPMNAPPSFGGTGNPATFSGVEPPASLPKNGVPIAVIGGIAAVAVVAVVLVAVGIARRSTEAKEPTPSVSVVASAAPIASAAPVASASVAEAEPPPPAADPDDTAAPPAPTTEPPAASSAAARPPTKPTAVATASVAPKTKPAPSAAKGTPSPPSTTTGRALGDDRKW